MKAGHTTSEDNIEEALSETISSTLASNDPNTATSSDKMMKMFATMLQPLVNKIQSVEMSLTHHNKYNSEHVKNVIDDMNECKKRATDIQLKIPMRKKRRVGVSKKNNVVQRKPKSKPKSSKSKHDSDDDDLSGEDESTSKPQTTTEEEDEDSVSKEDDSTFSSIAKLPPLGNNDINANTIVVCKLQKYYFTFFIDVPNGSFILYLLYLLLTKS
jgi:hypothetical protein